MKISPLSNGGGSPGQVLGNVEVGRTANPMKLARAKAIASGQEPVEQVQEETSQLKPNPRSIKMLTQRSTNREELVPEQAEEVVQAAPESSAPVTSEAVVEETKPLSPQFAALAKQRRALQLERAQLDKDKAAFEAQPAPTTGSDELLARLKSQPLSVLQENGISYDQLTEAILADQDGSSAKLRELESKLAAMEQSLDKKLTDRDAESKQSALNEMRREADRLAKDGDLYEMVRETRSVPKVVELIEKTFDKTGEILDVSEAMQLVEDELLIENLKLAKLKKVQGKLNPEPSSQPAQIAQPTMKTLTNRDSATLQMSRRQRALAACTGTLKR